MKIYEGTILTVDAYDRVVRYLVEENGRILYAGNDLPDQYKGSEIISLGGRAPLLSWIRISILQVLLRSMQD